MNEIEAYFTEHPDEEAEFVEEMARLYGDDEIDYPEDWGFGNTEDVEEWLVYA